MNGFFKKQIIFVSMIFVAYSYAEQVVPLYIFLGDDQKELSDPEGMIIAHQVLSALAQKQDGIIVDVDVWNHILFRKDRFEKQALDQSSLAKTLLDFIDQTNVIVGSSSSGVQLLQSCDEQWFSRCYQPLASLDQAVYHALCFDYFCSQLLALLKEYNLYAYQGYLIILKKNGIVPFSKFVMLENPYDQMSIGQNRALRSLLSCWCVKKRGISWAIYLSGHGHHPSESNQDTIATMSMEEFRRFLDTLQNNMKTRMFIYNSCFAGGEHSELAYQSNGAARTYSYPILTAALTLSPVYLFGEASGLYLPPYQKVEVCNQVVQSGRLEWATLQNFRLFHSLLATSCLDYKALMNAICPYQECYGGSCVLLSIENMPLIRKPHAAFFVPVDPYAFDIVIHPKSKISLTDKHAVLWYTNYSLGTVIIGQMLKPWIMMLPRVKVVYLYAICYQNGATILDFLVALFRSIVNNFDQPDWFFDQIKLGSDCYSCVAVLHQKPKYFEQQCAVEQDSDWIAYLKDDTGYYASSLQSKDVQIMNNQMKKDYLAWWQQQKLSIKQEKMN